MNKPLLRMKSYDDSFTVTVGRSSPTFIFGVRNLPEGQGGFPAFILDAQKITTDSDTGDVILDDSLTYTYGGSDGRDLTGRNKEIPIGRFRFTKADLSLTVSEEENGILLYNRDFDVIETSRRVTGSAEYSGSVGQESLGTILPGRDISTGDNIELVVWEQHLNVIAGGYSNSPTGWTVSLSSPSPVNTKSITSKWARRNRDATSRKAREIGSIASGYEYGLGESSYTDFGTDTYSGWDDMPNTQEQFEDLSYEMRQIKNRNDLLAGGGVSEGDGGDNGGGVSPGSIYIIPGNIFSTPGGNSPTEGHVARVTATMRGVDRLHEEITDHLKDLSPQLSESRWSGSDTGHYILEDIGPLENVSSSGLGAFSWVLSDDIQGGWNYEWDDRPFQESGLWCGLIYLSINYVGKDNERGTHNAVARVSRETRGRIISVFSQDRVDTDWNIRVTSTERTLNVQSNIDSETEGSTYVNAIFIPDYGEMSKTFVASNGIGLIDKKITPSYNEESPGLAIESLQITGTISGTVL